jgi:dolichol-phosphate mannosyltransferase
MGEFSAGRVLLSRLGRRISCAIARSNVSDPMSGFFLLRRSLFLEVVHVLHGGGFKILLDILASCDRPLRIGEVGYTFRNRRFGESKLNANVALEYLFMIVNKASCGVVPARMVSFAVVAGSSLLLHFATLFLLLFPLHGMFVGAQLGATCASSFWALSLNNLVNTQERNLRGVYRLASLLALSAGCAFGAWASVCFATTLWRSGMEWYNAGLIGALLSAGWNDLVSNLFAWRMPRHSMARIPAHAFSGVLSHR